MALIAASFAQYLPYVFWIIVLGLIYNAVFKAFTGGGL